VSITIKKCHVEPFNIFFLVGLEDRIMEIAPITLYVVANFPLFHE
jgi:hypothetical protein